MYMYESHMMHRSDEHVSDNAIIIIIIKKITENEVLCILLLRQKVFVIYMIVSVNYTNLMKCIS